MNVVFDFGGVLFDWQPQALLARLIPARTRTPAERSALETEFFQGYRGDWGEFDRGTIEPGELSERIAARCELPGSQAREVIDAVAHELQPNAEMRSVVQALGARGHALHYLSNMPAPYAQHLERAHDVVGWFRSGVFSSRVGMIKPEAAIFAHASRVFGIEPHDTLLIDDNEANVLAARRAGWQALRFESAAQCRRSLSGAGLLA